MDFQQAEKNFNRLKAEFNAGQLSENEFKAQLEELMIQDEDGNWWMIGYETERWYMYDGSKWVQADPQNTFEMPVTPNNTKPLKTKTHRRKISEQSIKNQDASSAPLSISSPPKNYFLVFTGLFIITGLFALCSIFGYSQISALRNANALAIRGEQASETANFQTTLTSEALTSESVRVHATQTEKSHITQTAIIVRTKIAAARSTNTAIALATTESRSDFIASLEAGSQLVFGPDEGSLQHEVDNFIEITNADVELENFIATVTFTNPYLQSTGSWTYGFLFRDEYNNNQYRLVISSDQEWELKNRTEDSESITIQHGQLPNLDLSKGGMNTIRLFCQGTKGILFVNGNFISDLDLSERTNAGDVRIGTGFYRDDEIEGYSTDFEDFSVWEIP